MRIASRLSIRPRDPVALVTRAGREAVLAAMRRTAGVASAAVGAVGRDLGDPAEGYSHAYCVGVEDLASRRPRLNAAPGQKRVRSLSDEDANAPPEW